MMRSSTSSVDYTRVNEAIGQRVDSAIIFGVNRPRNRQNDIITLARQAGNNVAVGSSPDYYNLLW